MRSGSSSSSSDRGPKKGEKGKGEKSKSKKAKKQKKEQKKEQKKDKKDKKDTKEGKRERERAERAEAWDCDRAEGIRLLGQLLQIDPASADELEQVFCAIDQGETVNINGLENKPAKKKLRHLLQAMRLAPAEGQGFRTADKRVSFAALFQLLLCRARKGGETVAGVAAAAPEATANAARAGPDAERTGEAAAAAGASADSAREAAAAGEGADGEATAPLPPPVRGVVGPVLPMPTVAPLGAAAGVAGEGEEDEGGTEGGPKLEGSERRGVDLDMLDSVAQRPAWMSQPSESMAGLFGEGSGKRRGEFFDVKRSRKEQEEFEKMYKARGNSLLQQTQEGAFSGHQDEADHVQKRLKAAQTPWGASAKEQARQRPFDPEQDLTVRKPITGADFSKLVENSVTGLADRFSRGNVATSFL